MTGPGVLAAVAVETSGATPKFPMKARHAAKQQCGRGTGFIGTWAGLTYPRLNLAPTVGFLLHLLHGRSMSEHMSMLD